MTRSDCYFYDMLGKIKDFFDREVDLRVSKVYPARVEKEILRGMLTDTSRAIEYAKFVHQTRSEVLSEIETALGKHVDVGFDPDIASRVLFERVDDLEGTTNELNEALNMILEGAIE